MDISAVGVRQPLLPTHHAVFYDNQLIAVLEVGNDGRHGQEKGTQPVRNKRVKVNTHGHCDCTKGQLCIFFTVISALTAMALIGIFLAWRPWAP